MSMTPQRGCAHLAQKWGATTAILLQVQQGEERRRVTAVGELPCQNAGAHCGVGAARDGQYRVRHEPRMGEGLCGTR